MRHIAVCSSILAFADMLKVPLVVIARNHDPSSLRNQKLTSPIWSLDGQPFSHAEWRLIAKFLVGVRLHRYAQLCVIAHARRVFPSQFVIVILKYVNKQIAESYILALSQGIALALGAVKHHLAACAGPSLRGSRIPLQEATLREGGECLLLRFGGQVCKSLVFCVLGLTFEFRVDANSRRRAHAAGLVHCRIEDVQHILYYPVELAECGFLQDNECSSFRLLRKLKRTASKPKMGAEARMGGGGFVVLK